jgi:hypothetical protein
MYIYIYEIKGVVRYYESTVMLVLIPCSSQRHTVAFLVYSYSRTDKAGYGCDFNFIRKSLLPRCNTRRWHLVLGPYY